MRVSGGLSLLRRLLLSALRCFLGHLNPPFQVPGYARVPPPHFSALCRLARRAGWSAFWLRSNSRKAGEQQKKKKGCPFVSTPRSSEELPLLRGLLLAALGSLFRHF